MSILRTGEHICHVHVFTFVFQSLFGIVQQISTTQSEKDDGTVSQEPGTHPGSRSSFTTSTPHKVVGPTAAELESINELIKFDHEYYKHQSMSAETDIETSSQQAVTNSSTKVNICVTQDLPTKSISEDPVKNEPEISAITETVDLTDINLDLLKDIESLIGFDFQDQFEQNSVESISQSGQCTQNEGETKDTISKNDRKRKRSETVSSPSVTDMYESSDNLDNAVFSDSGFTSDFSDACSPLSDISGGLDDNPWEESFMELFPTLA